MRAIGVKAFMEKNFDTFAFEGEWLDSFGEPEKNFKMLLYGPSGEGKTELSVKFAKYMANFGKVYYFSFEQGISKTLQDAIIRNQMDEVSGKVIFLSGGSFEELMQYVKKSRAKTIFIDSLDYMKLTVEQFKILIKTYPKKAFIIVAWAKNGTPKSQHAKDIEFMCDIKSLVDKFRIPMPTSRFGGNKEFVIWKGANDKNVRSTHKPLQPSLFDQV